MFKRIPGTRALATTAAVVVASVGSVAGVSLAQDGNSATGTTPTQSATSHPGGILADVHTALAGLVAEGTIDQQQADAVQTQADAGSIDPKQLVDSGTLTDAQMRAVAGQIDQVKRSYGG